MSYNCFNRNRLFLIIFFLNILQSEVPSWDVNPSEYEFTASMTGILIFDDVESSDATDIIAAFSGDECRGVKTDGIIFPPTGQTVFGITLYSNQNGETITFKAYDFSTDQIYSSDALDYNFVSNDVVGSGEIPIEWSFTDPNLGIFNELIPNEFNLFPAYPNPFNPATTIQFSVGMESFVSSDSRQVNDTSIQVYDINGELVETLLNENLSSGRYTLQWNATSFSSGVYFLLMENGEEMVSQKVVLIK